MTEPIRLKKDGGIVEVLLSRPEAFNAFNLDMIESSPLKNTLSVLRWMTRYRY